MNKLLCVTGFLLCFSSFGMNEDANWNDDIIKEQNAAIQRSNDLRKAAMLRVAKKINEQKFQEACNILSIDGLFDVNAIFLFEGKEYTLLSWYLYKINFLGVNVNPSSPIFMLGRLLLEKSKGQFEMQGDCYIRENDQRILDVVLSAIDSKCFNFTRCFLQIFCLNKFLDVNIKFEKEKNTYTLLSLCIPVLKDQIKIESGGIKGDCVSDLVEFLILESRGQLKMQGDCYIRENDQRILDVVLSAINMQKIGFAHCFLKKCFFCGYLTADTTFTIDGKKHTLLSLFLSFLKDHIGCIVEQYQVQCLSKDVIAANFVKFLLEQSKDQLKSATEHDYPQKDDQIFIDIALSAINIECFKFASCFLFDCFTNKYLDPLIPIKNGDNVDTFLSLYISKFEKYIGTNDLYFFTLGSVLLEASKDQLFSKAQDESKYYIKQNDERIVDIVLSIINTKCFIAYNFLCGCFKNGYLDVNMPLKNVDNTDTFFAHYLNVLKDKSIVLDESYTRAFLECMLVAYKDQLNIGVRDKKKCYIVKNDPSIINLALFAVDGKCFKFMHDLLLYCSKYGYLVDAVAEYEDVLCSAFYFCAYILKNMPSEMYSSSSQYIFANNDIVKYKNKMMDMISFLLEKRYNSIAYLFLNEYFRNKNLYENSDEIEYNTFSILLFLFKKMGIEAFNECDFSGVQPNKEDVINIMAFLVEKKQYGIANFLLSNFLSKKILVTNSIFSYRIGDGEANYYTPLSFCSFYAIKDLQEFSDEQKAYFVNKMFRIAKDNSVLKWLIQKTQGSQKELLLLLMNNTKIESLVYKRYIPLLNDIQKYVAKIRLQIIGEYATCIGIIKMMRYYQE